MVIVRHAPSRTGAFPAGVGELVAAAVGVGLGVGAGVGVGEGVGVGVGVGEGAVVGGSVGVGVGVEVGASVGASVGLAVIAGVAIAVASGCAMVGLGCVGRGVAAHEAAITVANDIANTEGRRIVATMHQSDEHQPVGTRVPARLERAEDGSRAQRERRRDHVRCGRNRAPVCVCRPYNENQPA